MSDKKIIEWVRKVYGEKWANNIDLARRLYEKIHGRKYTYEVRNEIKEIDTFSEIKGEGSYSIEVIVLDIRKRKYLGCPKCRRKVDKGCVHILNRIVEPKEITALGLTVTDKSGDIRDMVIYIIDEDDYKEFDVGDMLKVNFYARNINGNIRMYTDGYEVVKRKELLEEDDDMNEGNVANKDGIVNEDIRDILEILSSVKSLNESPFLKMLSRKGLSLDDVKDYVVFDEDNRIFKLSDKGKELLEKSGGDE